MRVPMRICSLFVLVLICTQLVGSATPVVADDAFAPGTVGQMIRRGLFDTQEQLNAADRDGAQRVLAGLDDELAAFDSAFARRPDVRQALVSAWADVERAVADGDANRLAVARATVWTTLLNGAFQIVSDAVGRGDVDTAQTWLLLREYRPTTKFARPEANATLALRDLRAGSISPDDALLAVRADLLDSYQAAMTTELTALSKSSGFRTTSARAEAIGLLSGYWQMLEPSYEAQFGPEAAAEVNTLFSTAADAFFAGDEDALQASLASITELDHRFRAAPLSDDEKVRRAGQLIRYLELVPVEYARGVKGGEVTSDLEIQEARSFLDGAQASFNDLYQDLYAIDPAMTNHIGDELAWLDAAIDDAQSHRNVVSHIDLKQHAEAARSGLNDVFPAAWLRDGSTADFDVIGTLLDQMEQAVAAGDYDKAESARLEAYAMFDLGAEKRLQAFAPDMAIEIEGLFWGGNGDTTGLASALADHARVEEIRAIRSVLDDKLQVAQERIGAGRPAKGVVIFNAATIVFREGLEGVLILASLVAAMIGGNRKYKKPLLAGAGLAFAATALLFWAAQTVLQSLSRYGEKLEAVVSLIAIAVLLVIMNWFFHKVYWTRWISKHHTKRRAVIGGVAGQSLGLVTLGFTSVFREGAETVLFLQALTLDSGTAVVIEGTALGLLGTFIVGALVIALQKKLPHKRMLMVTGLMIAFVLVVMVGTTTHVMQAVGWMPITPLHGLVVPYWMSVWFGIYPTWQSVLLQVVALIAVIGSYIAAEYVSGNLNAPRFLARGPQVRGVSR